jgi:hypothetical protein
MTRTLGLNSRLVCGNPHCKDKEKTVTVRSYIQDSIKHKNVEWKEAYDKAYYAHEKQIYMNNPFLRDFDPKNPPGPFSLLF